jgi:hypothetical protein
MTLDDLSEINPAPSAPDGFVHYDEELCTSYALGFTA